MKQPNSLFITFEGGEGAGKSTLIRKVEQALTQKGYSVLVTREPGGSPLGEQIRSMLLNPNGALSISSMAELLLFLTARAQHLEETIQPALQEGKIVLCDRFNDSTIAYQGAGRGLGISRVQLLCDLVCHGLTPDLTLFLDVDPKVGLERTTTTSKENAKKGEVDRIEAEEIQFHDKIRKAFLYIAKQHPDRFYLIDAHQSPEAVFWEAMKYINTRFSHD